MRLEDLTAAEYDLLGRIHKRKQNFIHGDDIKIASRLRAAGAIEMDIETGARRTINVERSIHITQKGKMLCCIINL